MAKRSGRSAALLRLFEFLKNLLFHSCQVLSVRLFGVLIWGLTSVEDWMAVLKRTLARSGGRLSLDVSSIGA